MVSPKENIRHRKKYSSKNYKGVFLTKENRWRAAIGDNGETISLGSYATEEDAAKAYNIGAIIYHGEYAVLNDVYHEGF
jgi:hypothetical protein